MVQAQLLADLLDELGLDHAGRSRAYEEATRVEITPWYRAAVNQDRLARSAAASAPEPELVDPTGGDGQSTRGGTSDVDPADFVKSLLRDGLFPAMRVDPVVLRAFLRMFNLLEPPDSLMSDADVIGRVMAVYQDRGNRPPEPSLGPDRAGLLAAI
jgi:hypothetical protein